MKLTIFKNESAEEVMDQLRFLLMEFGVVLETTETDKESTTYQFTAAKPLDTDEEEGDERRKSGKH